MKSYVEFDFTLVNLAGVFAIGIFYDAINASYFILPLLVYLWLLPERIFKTTWHRFIVQGFFLVLIFILMFTAIGEWFFWDEFNTRFNFIAVDYLVYTTEVIGNIRQSYPIEWIIVGLLVVTFALLFFLRPFLNGNQNLNMRFKERSIWFLGFICIPVLSFFLITNKLHHFSSNAYANELAGNGMYELFAAYRNNELNYDQFYTSIEKSTAFENVRQLLQTKDVVSVPAKGFSIERQIGHAEQEKKFNIVLISIESFSASFMESFGGKNNITPFLDSLTQYSLSFTNLYATGTRTVRGLEALSLCVPPTPGQSIVRRPGNENLFSLATVFNEKGYESKYIYGGYGYFDNMNYFFGNNGYRVVDRSALADTEIDYENIWGVADENLFTLTLREIDKTMDAGKPVFTHIMTTSNHRPYTYPDGRIDIPSHTSRAGAVKYTDYSIKKFIREASKKPWFGNTIFVITSDHCASSAGKTELPIEKYHIPMLIFSPGNIKPGIQPRLMSQIDIGPTLFGLLNFSYSSKFFGYDIYALPVGEERAFISTYQLLGYIKSDSLVVLAPTKAPELYLIGADRESITPVAGKAMNFPITNAAIAWYQTASYSFANGLMKK